MVDLKKPVQTKDGRAVRILCTDLSGTLFPVVAAVVSVGSTHEFIVRYCPSGLAHGEGRELDLVQKPELVNVLINVYRRSSGTIYATASMPNESFSPGAIASAALTLEIPGEAA